MGELKRLREIDSIIYIYRERDRENEKERRGRGRMKERMLLGEIRIWEGEF